jgi:hypothetical protein
MTRPPGVCLTFAIAVALEMVVIYVAYRRGITSKMIPWDECAYIYTDLINADLIRSVGIISALPGLFFSHAPLTDLQDTVALLLSGNRLTAPYLFNIFYVFLYLGAINRALRNFGVVPVVAFSVMAVSAPTLFLFSSHLKADYLAGCFAFVMLVELFLVDGAATTLRAARYNLAAASLLGSLAVLSKPMAFYVPGLICFIFVSHLFRQAATGRLHDRWTSSAASYVVAGALPVTLYAAVALPHLEYFISYIKQALSPPWASHVSLLERFSFYLPVPAGSAPFGFWGVGFAAFIFLGIVFAWIACRKLISRDDAITILTLAAVAAASFVPLVASPQLQTPFGAIFSGAVIATFLGCYVALKHTNSRYRLLDWALIGTSLACFSLPVEQYQSVIPSTPKDISQGAAVIHRFVADIASPNSAQHPNIYFNYSPIPDYDFGIEYYLVTHRFPASVSLPVLVNEAISEAVKASDYVVLYVPDVPVQASDNQYRVLMYTTADSILKHRQHLREIDRLPYADGHYILYKVDWPADSLS